MRHLAGRARCGWRDRRGWRGRHGRRRRCGRNGCRCRGRRSGRGSRRRRGRGRGGAATAGSRDERHDREHVRQVSVLHRVPLLQAIGRGVGQGFGGRPDGLPCSCSRSCGGRLALVALPPSASMIQSPRWFLAANSRPNQIRPSAVQLGAPEAWSDVTWRRSVPSGRTVATSTFGPSEYPVPLPGSGIGTGRCGDSKTMRVPSGDQSASSPAPLIWWRFPPSASTTKTATRPDRSLDPVDVASAR